MTVDPTLPSRLMDQEARYGAGGGQALGVICARADGAHVWDVQGARYLDFLAGCGAAAQGHNHTRIAAAMVEQCLRLCQVSRSLHNDRTPPLLEKLCTLSGFEQALLMNTGAEAVEAAVQALRRWGYARKGIAEGQAEIVVFSGNAHGCTTTLAGLAEGPEAARSCGPFTPGFRIVPYGDLAAARAAAGPSTCGILVEPVQGESGVVLPPRGFLRGLRELCDSQRILLVADEVQCGLGRTGRLFAFEHEGIRPDGATLGKALSGGFYPVSALLGNRELLAGFNLGAHVATYAGNPLACAVASAALDVLLDEKLVDRSAELGAYFLAQLRALDSGLVREVRGLGLWAGVELRPEAGGARGFCEALAREGLLCRENRGHTIHLCPPLVITREQLDWAVARLRLVLGAS